ncbi:terminase [Sphingopyxis macrogoltabida]|uniref:Terminase n=2 Tax=Sphingopyxis macrogoltabida TaxID=33050 RepID=A0AAC9AXL5_SPHMC|nr:terminase [Sphingopyxis macrogoltabida]
MTPQADPAYLEALWEAATPEEREEIRRLLDHDLSHHIWRAQLGRQSEAADSLAFITGYGGAAGGGKTDLIAGLSLTEHQRSAIFRHEKSQTEGIIQRLNEILGGNTGYNSQKSVWKTTVANIPRLIEFYGLADASDHQKAQGRAHDGKFYDEVTEQRESQVRFTMGWTRSKAPAQRCRVLMTMNPPTTTAGRWVIKFFGPWLNDQHPNPAAPGELRWFTTVNGNEDYECPDGRPFVLFRGEPLYDYDPREFPIEKIITPISRTFIPSRTKDNYFYVRSGYIQTLQMLPEPLRSQMLDGNFSAGVEDDEWQVIPTDWVQAAMDRWEPRPNGKGEMDSMGVDPAWGGRDNFVISPRYGAWFDDLVIIPGHEIPKETAGRVGAAKVIQHRRDRAPVHVDLLGGGLATYNALHEDQIQVVGVDWSRGSSERSADGQFEFFNLRSEQVWRMREALDPASPVPIALPPRPTLKADLCAYRWTPIKGEKRTKVKVRSKDEMKSELGRSPDEGDAVVMANIDTIKTEVVKALTKALSRTRHDPYADLHR